MNEPPGNTHSANRIGYIDFWRGLCILGMVSWHLLTHEAFPRAISFAVIQSFNFVAEGFVFLAGVSVAISLANGRRMNPWKFESRAMRLLAVHYLTVLSLVLGFGFVNGLGPSVNPFPFPLPRTPWDILFLQYQPYLADVLTIFVFLFAATPLLVLICRRYGQRALLTGSFLVFCTSHALYAVGGRTLQAAFEINSKGAFDVNTWQFVFVLGLLSGDSLRKLSMSRSSIAMWLFAALLSLAVLGVLRSLTENNGPWANAVPHVLRFDRHPLTATRLAYVAAQMTAIGLLTIQFWEYAKSWRVTGFVSLWGRHSLTLFVCSVFLDYLLKFLLTWWDGGRVVAVAYWGIELGILTCIAQNRARREQSAKSCTA